VSATRRGRPQPRGAERVAWRPLIELAANIVRGERYGMTLRGLFYRLVAQALLRNSRSHYTTLSRHTAAARRDGRFPDLVDRGRMIRRPLAVDGSEDAREWLRSAYRRDRTEGQPYAIYLGVEKNALAGPLEHWADERGLPVLALGGYSSQTFVDLVARDVCADGRPSVFIYAGDLDPSGEHIDRDFLRRCGVFDHVERVALTPEQVERFALPPQVGKADDPRAADFIARHGRLVQVELDALPLEALHDLYFEAVDRYFDLTKFDLVSAREATEREAL
jgi:hypothetical protein